MPAMATRIPETTSPRVISLLPSATEILCLIGGASRLVARSHECDFPNGIADRPVVTASRLTGGASAEVDRDVRAALVDGDSLYRLDAARVQALVPDVILTQDLCRVCSIDLAAVRGLASSMDPVPEVVSLNPGSFEDVLDDVVRVGDAVGLAEEARRVVVELRERFFRAADHVTPYVAEPSVVVLEWTDPLFVAGHWTPQLVERAGGSHPLNPTEAMEGAGAGAGGQMAHRRAGASREVSVEELVGVAPDVIVVAPCGLTLDEAVAALERDLRGRSWWDELPAVRAGRVAVVDGNAMFSRPGPRLVDGYEWLVSWLNDRPELCQPEFPVVSGAL